MILYRITGEQNAELALESARIRVRDGVRKGVRRNQLRVLAHVKENKLSGQVLKNRTGTLRRRANAPALIETQASTIGRVVDNVAYAAAHEYGFQGSVRVALHQVKAHWRIQRQQFGRPVPPRSVRVDAYRVREHTMRMHLPERSFLRSALADLAPSIQTDLESSVLSAVRGAP